MTFMILDPCSRIRVINDTLFKTIYVNFFNNITSYKFATEKLNKYREISHQLAELLPFDKKIKAIETTEESYSKYADLINKKSVENGNAFKDYV